MPRSNRQKTYNSTYHIMCRANGDDLLFREDFDKDRYLSLVKRYKEIYKFKVYAYCLMDTHCHLIIYANGADISSIMHDINQSYAQHYYNRKYHRRGHVFCDRFKSKQIKDDKYLLTAWGYIHNNPVDIPGFQHNVQDYLYSSLGIYLGTSQDTYNIIDQSFVSKMLSNNPTAAKNKMRKLVKKCTDETLKNEVNFKTEKQDYRSEKSIIHRDFLPEEVLDFVSEFLNCPHSGFHVKNVPAFVQLRSLGALMLKTLCNLTERQIALLFGDITQSAVSLLLKRSQELIDYEKYSNLLNLFLQKHIPISEI